MKINNLNKYGLHKSMLGGVFLLLFLLGLNIFLKSHQIISLHFLLTRIFFWVVLIIMFFYAKKIEPQQYLLYKEKKYSFWKAILMGFGVFLIVGIGNTIILIILKKLGLTEEVSTINKITGLTFKDNYLLLIFACITAGITEELLIRGYLQTRLEKIFNSAWVGIVLSALIFGLLHIGYGTLSNVVGTIWIGLIFSIFYYKYRNIKILIFLHFLMDLILIIKNG